MKRLKTCQSVLISVFNTRLKKTTNENEKYYRDHWGLAVLYKHSATLRLYDSCRQSQGFEEIIPYLLQLANSIHSKYSLTQAGWSIHWTYCCKVYSMFQGNSYDCGIFVLMNAFHVSRGISKPRVIPKDQACSSYHLRLGLCILESDNSFLL